MIQVTHSNFGKGSVINQDANNVTVDFNGVQKTLVTKYANLLNEDGTAFYIAPVIAPKKKYKPILVSNAVAAANKNAIDRQLAEATYYAHRN